MEPIELEEGCSFTVKDGKVHFNLEEWDGVGPLLITRTDLMKMVDTIVKER